MRNYRFRSLARVALSPLVLRVWLATILIVALLIFMLFLPWQQTVKGIGKVIALDPSERDYEISATIDGIITALHVHEGLHVSAGAPLFEMRDLDADLPRRLREAAQSLLAQRTQLVQEQQSLHNRKTNTRAALDQAMARFAQREAQAQAAVRKARFALEAASRSEEVELAQFKRTEALYASGLESRRSFERSGESLLRATALREAAQSELEVHEAAVQIVQQEREQSRLELHSALESLEGSIAALQSRLEALSREEASMQTSIERNAASVVRAPKEGSVVRVLHNDGARLLRRGEAVLHFAPDVTQRALLVEVSGFNMPLIKVGLKTRIMFYGWPAFQISGWPTIRFGTFSGIIARVDPIAHETGRYYVYVVEDPNEPWPKEALRIGTQANVWAALSTVQIWYELWRLMNASPPQMVEPILSEER
ncbi:MAG: hypothetical protein JXK05_12990 [Campylobacterales bacterium]|nr:hypothetical protein [Campylobacterales bacterium]